MDRRWGSLNVAASNYVFGGCESLFFVHSMRPSIMSLIICFLLKVGQQDANVQQRVVVEEVTGSSAPTPESRSLT